MKYLINCDLSLFSMRKKKQMERDQFPIQSVYSLNYDKRSGFIQYIQNRYTFKMFSNNRRGNKSDTTKRLN